MASVWQRCVVTVLVREWCEGGYRVVASEVERGRLATKAVVVRQIRSGGVGGWAQGRLGEMELRRQKSLTNGGRKPVLRSEKRG
ncbi:hypothetical protein L1887_12191 [Cichorium endivia]|nr:hypothetical protein L1887_12191 [Cichorium endivia]